MYKLKQIIFLITFFFIGCSNRLNECSIIEKSLYSPTEFNYHNVSRELKDIPFIISRYIGIHKFLFDDANSSKEFYGSKSIIYSDALLYKSIISCDSRDNNSFYNLSKKAYDIYFENQKHYLFQFDNEEQKNYIKENKRYLLSIFTSTYLFQKKNNVTDTFNKWLNYKRTLYDIDNAISLSNSLYNKLKKELARLNQEEKDYSKIEFITKRLSYEYKSSLYSIEYQTQKKLSYKDIQTILTPNQLYLDFAKVGENYYYFTLDNQANIQFKKIDKAQSKEIDDYIQRIRKDGNISIQTTQNRYAKLYNIIFKDIDLKNKTSLIISPDGLLGLIPFEAFYDGEKYLIEKVKIRYIPSGKELVKLYRDKTKSQNNDIVVFADINFDTTISKTKGVDIYKRLKFGKLANSKRDVMVVKKLFPNQVKLFLEDNATEKNLFKINSPKILYLSTHGFFIDDKNILNPMLKSGIALSGANSAIDNKTGDGIVTGLELAGLNLHGTELVVLSACKTGMGDIEEAEGVASLSKAFMLAGAKNIIMTLWRVDDEKSSLLMQKFYENIKQGVNYSNALREAKLWMIKDNNSSHPYFWSGFVGSGRD